MGNPCVNHTLSVVLPNAVQTTIIVHIHGCIGPDTDDILFDAIRGSCGNVLSTGITACSGCWISKVRCHDLGKGQIDKRNSFLDPLKRAFPWKGKIRSACHSDSSHSRCVSGHAPRTKDAIERLLHRTTSNENIFDHRLTKVILTEHSHTGLANECDSHHPNKHLA